MTSLGSDPDPVRLWVEGDSGALRRATEDALVPGVLGLLSDEITSGGPDLELLGRLGVALAWTDATELDAIVAQWASSQPSADAVDAAAAVLRGLWILGPGAGPSGDALNRVAGWSGGLHRVPVALALAAALGASRPGRTARVSTLLQRHLELHPTMPADVARYCAVALGSSSS